MNLQWESETGNESTYHWAQGNILRWAIEQYTDAKMFFIHMGSKVLGTAQDLITAREICQAYETDNPRLIRWVETDDIHMDSREAMGDYRITLDEKSADEALYKNGKLVITITQAGLCGRSAGERACRLAALLDGLAMHNAQREGK